MTTLPLFPAVFIDFLGSAMAILLSFMALRYSLLLVRFQPNNFIWGFLFYFCVAMAAFSLSRGVGHIIRILLVFSDNVDTWKKLSPFSGGFNSVLMVSAAAVTIYYHKGLAAYKAIRKEAEKLAEANTKLSLSASQLQKLNTHLEEMVDERTRNLSESEKKFRNFFENSKDIIFFCNKEGIITNLNSSGKQVLGITNEQKKINFFSLFNTSSARERYSHELERNGFVRDFEMEYDTPDGLSLYILLSANSITDTKGSIIGYEGIGKDMTRLKTVTEQLINHEKMASVGQMAAGVAHEINTPLGIILGYTQLMMDDFEEGGENHSNLTVVERQTKACRRIVADLLKFSRQSESAKTLLDINTVIQEVLAVSEHTLNINQIQIVREFDQELPHIIGDAEKLRQVFINLFNNAQYALKDGGEIVITTGQTEKQVTISVRDNGTGVPAEIKNRIFDPFFTTKDVGKGTGLGLSVTYGIIQEHQGSISVESPVYDNESKSLLDGTAFHIWLPRQEAVENNQKEELDNG